jgi:hypothetical protein
MMVRQCWLEEKRREQKRQVTDDGKTMLAGGEAAGTEVASRTRPNELSWRDWGRPAFSRQIATHRRAGCPTRHSACSSRWKLGALWACRERKPSVTVTASSAANGKWGRNHLRYQPPHERHQKLPFRQLQVVQLLGTVRSTSKHRRRTEKVWNHNHNTAQGTESSANINWLVLSVALVD